MDADAGAARIQGLEAHKAEGEDVARRGAPRVIPVLIWLKGIVPSLQGKGRANPQHIIPTAHAIRRQQTQRIIRLASLVQGIQQELGPIDTAGHSARPDKRHHALLPLRRNQAKQQRKHIGMQGRMDSPQAIHIHPAGRVIKLIVKYFLHLSSRIIKGSRILRIPQMPGHLLHQDQRMVEPGIYHRVAIRIDIAIILAALSLGQPRPAGMRPIHDIADGGRPVNGSQEFRRLQSGSGADQAAIGPQRQERPRLQQGIMLADKTVVPGKHPVVPGDGNSLQDPFGRPGGMLQQMGQRLAGRLEGSVRSVVAKLVDEGVGLVGNPLAVAINVIACK